MDADYRPTLSGAEWHIIVALLFRDQKGGPRSPSIRGIAEDIYLLLRSRPADATVTTATDHKRVLEWHDVMVGYGYQPPKFLSDSEFRPFAQEITVSLSAEERVKLAWAAEIISRGPSTNPQLAPVVSELLDSLSKRPRASIRRTSVDATRSYRAPMAWAKAGANLRLAATRRTTAQVVKRVRDGRSGSTAG